ncbi:unnamed protein product [[Candida] boidinii]|uniref:Signal peptidase complex subunit 2 n=1 Tax=Candida boidinii TaxID=5477 RepID=A0A9W6WI60_CANBO|nr:hypothetical protein B5S30_g274 [[Candida] boidinii]OWB83082.1 hypothetical protein B5S33_g1711 [[Candida] boidinii]GME72812.1 unnamed protein product [[Candida] boidinii]GMF98611.1 unnamed protein product [[Candida] boidinii]
MAHAQKKIDLYSAVSLRTECDENLGNIMEILGYSQDFKLIDIKLALGYASVIIAAGLFKLEKTFNNDFHTTDYVSLTFLGVIAFALLNTVSYILGKLSGDNLKYAGSNSKTNKKVKIETTSKVVNAIPEYQIKLLFDNSKTINTKIEFTKLFNEDGFLQVEELTKFLKYQIEVSSSSKQ